LEPICRICVSSKWLVFNLLMRPLLAGFERPLTRKEWILDRLRELAGLFSVEVCGYSVMSNHLHLVLRNRPDIAGQWSDDEIALRWCKVFPPRDDATGEPVEPGEADVARLAANPERLVELRKRLASLSWFMRCLCEKIARAANREDRSGGRFLKGAAYCLHSPCLTIWITTDGLTLAPGCCRLAA
jgi:hypothetical protein